LYTFVAKAAKVMVAPEPVTEIHVLMAIEFPVIVLVETKAYVVGVQAVQVT